MSKFHEFTENGNPIIIDLESIVFAGPQSECVTSIKLNGYSDRFIWIDIAYDDFKQILGIKKNGEPKKAQDLSKFFP